LSYPSGLDVDYDGSVVVADRGNNRIRHISFGSISTKLGDGSAGPQTGPCRAATAPVCALARPSDVKLREPSDQAPTQLSSEYFVAERGGASVLRTYVGAGGGIEARRIGTGSPGWADGTALTAGLSTPTGLAWDRVRQELYVADGADHRIRRWNLISGRVDTVVGDGNGKRYDWDAFVAPAAGDGPGLATSVNFPIGLAVRHDHLAAPGELLFTSPWENQVRVATFADATPVCASSVLGALGC
jgi:hypothetical protein